MTLQTLAIGAQHGYGIEQAAGDRVLLNQGAIYASLIGLQQRRWIPSEWGPLDSNRKSQVFFDHKARRKAACRPSIGRGYPAQWSAWWPCPFNQRSPSNMFYTLDGALG